MNTVGHLEVRTTSSGQLTWLQEYEDERCFECGRVIPDGEDSYECRTHLVVCEECLKMLHKRYV